MAEIGLMVDTSILIDFFRKTEKGNSRLFRYFKEGFQLYISAITEFEVYNGATEQHKIFWRDLLSQFVVLDFDSRCAVKAADLILKLKAKRKTLEKPYLFIAATAIVHNLEFDTLNLKHFIEIEEIKLITTNI